MLSLRNLIFTTQLPEVPRVNSRFARDIFNTLLLYLKDGKHGLMGDRRARQLFDECTKVSEANLPAFIAKQIQTELSGHRLIAMLSFIYNRHYTPEDSLRRNVSDALEQYVHEWEKGESYIGTTGIDRAIALLKRNLNKTEHELKLLIEEDYYLGLDTSITCRKYLHNAYLKTFNVEKIPFDFKYWVNTTIDRYIDNVEGGTDGIKNARRLKAEFKALETEMDYAYKIWDLIHAGEGSNLRTKLGLLLCTFRGISRKQVSVHESAPYTGQVVPLLQAISFAIQKHNPLPEKTYGNMEVIKAASDSAPSPMVSALGKFGVREHTGASPSSSPEVENPFVQKFPGMGKR